jgi:hypothetical protein
MVGWLGTKNGRKRAVNDPRKVRRQAAARKGAGVRNFKVGYTTHKAVVQKCLEKYIRIIQGILLKQVITLSN